MTTIILIGRTGLFSWSKNLASSGTTCSLYSGLLNTCEATGETRVASAHCQVSPGRRAPDLHSEDWELTSRIFWYESASKMTEPW